jgi:hypothetical protein
MLGHPHHHRRRHHHHHHRCQRRRRRRRKMPHREYGLDTAPSLSSQGR